MKRAIGYISYTHGLRGNVKIVPMIDDFAEIVDELGGQVLLKNNESLKQKMKNVLMCYSIRNSSIGYCQGFNFLVLRLLEVLQGEVIYKLLFNINFVNRKKLFGCFAI